MALETKKGGRQTAPLWNSNEMIHSRTVAQYAIVPKLFLENMLHIDEENIKKKKAQWNILGQPRLRASYSNRTPLLVSHGVAALLASPPGLLPIIRPWNLHGMSRRSLGPILPRFLLPYDHCRKWEEIVGNQETERCKVQPKRYTTTDTLPRFTIDGAALSDSLRFPCSLALSNHQNSISEGREHCTERVATSNSHLHSANRAKCRKYGVLRAQKNGAAWSTPIVR